MSAGYEISIPHFYCLEYRQGERRLLLEIDFRDPEIILEEALITDWEPPYAGAGIAPADKKRIMCQVYDYLVRQRGFSNVKCFCL